MSRRPHDTRNAALFEGLENRQLMAATPTLLGIKVANVPAGDGTTSNSNRITIAFTDTVRLTDATKFSSFGYANSLTNANKQVKARVNMTITRDATDARVITIITDRLIRKGSKLYVYTGALTDKQGNSIAFEGNNALIFKKGQNKPRYSLANRNFQPTDLSYFDKSVFASAPTATTASSTPSAATIRTNLAAFMNAKIGAVYGGITKAQADQALAIYDSDTAVGIIPNANLRAALASLVGTAAEPAINSYIGKTNVTGKSYSIVDFGSTSGSAPVGETKLSSKGRLYLTVRSDFAGEPFQVLSATLAHEAIHQDSSTTSSAGDLPSSQDEEIVANAVETIVYGQQLLIDPSVAANGTQLVVRTNTRLLALINSGDGLFPYGGIFQEPGLKSDGNVFVGAKTDPGSFGDTSTVKSFENWIRREYVSRGYSAGATTNSPVGQSILKNIVGSASFNVTKLGSDTEKALDVGNKLLTDQAYIRLAQSLKLNYVL